ncbi:MAG: OmpA family protein [Polyangiales bacterium]
MNDAFDESHEDQGHDALGGALWPAVGDLMACLFGLFVLFFVWAIAFQVELTHSLESAHKDRVVATERAQVLEKQLAETLEQTVEARLASDLKTLAGRITIEGGKLGIGGAVLFETSSAELQVQGAQLLGALAPALADYLRGKGHEKELIMVSGFTDDSPVKEPSRSMKDNWDLSSSRANNVVRMLVSAGVPRDRIFAAGFGDTHPVASNADEVGRAKNRRVEIGSVPAR